ncbi:fumarylacetoacetate hydrolase family protein [Acinetobacter haemolyticus]|uniref:Fumarylacetoacetate hydrolase family protein n=1 Tax=Acinetobacter haemolyticus TaxID=29430 RepID=A0AAW4J304_ACIHA|nr:fumarylacetoacetate hydrolase family protein [Acinetobacter haemolyticus]MBO3656694.1 fumarylacetoacetate hydrolase family protein [Acinetobacter haemolyticus]
MALHIVRFNHAQLSTQWGILNQDQITILDLEALTTAELIEHGYATLQRLSLESKRTIAMDKVQFLSPVTSPSQVICQGANYRQHMIDSGMDPDAKTFNMLFTKSVASITNPIGTIIKPKHVQLLDYEIELTLVLGKDTNNNVQVYDGNLHEYVAGICIGNDISARDVQIPEMQFYKGKSYRTFCPLGPVLCLLDKDEIHYLNEMELVLKVNGEIRQKDSSANLVYKPAETLTEFSTLTNFSVGDLLMTGTPSGCALGLPPPSVVRMTSLLPEQLKWKLFINSQAKRSQYLKVGDVIESSIVSKDGKIQLGCQRHVVESD